jgi:hypothetical protein
MRVLIVAQLLGALGLAAACLAGTIGAALVVAAAGWRSWPLVVAGSLLLGGGNAAVMPAR